MRKIKNPSDIRQWGYQDKRLGKGYSGTREHIIIQVQNDYVKDGIEFREQEIPALIDDFMCDQGLVKDCSERIDGLGDLVHLFAAPIARISDALLGTNFVGCGGCAGRRKALNDAAPL